MEKGHALIVGINKVDSDHYNGWDGRLSQPEADATVIKSKLDEYNFESKLLLTKDATRANVISGIQNLALKAEGGDLVFIYYSGHGGQVPTLEYYSEDDRLNETWCLYDGQLIDNELYRLWSKFKEGVRVFLVSDSCHSGTITKSMPGSSGSDLIPKNMPDHLIKEVFAKNVDFYTEIYKELTSLPKEEIKVSVLSYGGCEDSQSSYAFRDCDNSVFTTHFLKILNAPITNTYAEVIERIRQDVRQDVGRMQTPSIYEIGNGSSFQDEKLLKI